MSSESLPRSFSIRCFCLIGKTYFVSRREAIFERRPVGFDENLHTTLCLPNAIIMEIQYAHDRSLLAIE